MAFETFDPEKKGVISTTQVGTIMGMLGHEIEAQELSKVILEIDMWGKYDIPKMYKCV